MKSATLLFIFFLAIGYGSAHAQEISFKDTISAYNTRCAHIDNTGSEILGAWGIANIATGSAGYFTAKQDEWKYFHEMNAIWGAVNTGIAVGSLYAIRRVQNRQLTYQQSYAQYRASKKYYLINSGLDILFIGVGLGLAKHAETATDNVPLFKGFGRSVTLQGAFLFVLNNVMFATHQRSNTKWLIIMDELRVTNNGIGFTHTF